MGKRINQPAVGSWFVPGGRIKKGEDVSSALSRIGEMEIGMILDRKKGRFINVYDHFYNTNYANVEGISTQYVVLAFEFNLEIDLRQLPLDQHSEWKWIAGSESGTAHNNSAAYFKSCD